MTKHTKVLRCRIDDNSRITILKKNRNISIPISYTAEEIIDLILEKHPNENAVIKTEKGGGGSWRIANGEINKPHPKSFGATAEKGTTKWLYLIKSDGTVWTIINERYIGEKVR